MKASDLKDKSVSELKNTLNELRRKNFKLRLVKAGGDLNQTHEFKQARRDIARILTILTEKEGITHE